MYLYLTLMYIGALNYWLRFWGSAACFSEVADNLAAVLGADFESFVSWQFSILAWLESFGFVIRYGLNLCLMLDLVWMITRPFDNKSKQLKMYYASSILAAAVFATWLRSNPWIVQSALIAFVILAAWSINFARNRLNRAGFS